MSRRPSRRGFQEDGEDGPGGSRPRPELPRERAAPRESHPGTEPEPGLCGWCGGLPGRRAERLRGQGGTQLQPLRAAPRPLALVSQAPPPCPGPLDSGAPASPKCGHHVACLGPCPRPTLLERSLFSLCPVRVWVPLRIKHRPWPTAAPEPVTGQLGNTTSRATSSRSESGLQLWGRSAEPSGNQSSAGRGKVRNCFSARRASSRPGKDWPPRPGDMQVGGTAPPAGARRSGTPGPRRRFLSVRALRPWRAVGLGSSVLVCPESGKQIGRQARRSRGGPAQRRPQSRTIRARPPPSLHLHRRPAWEETPAVLSAVRDLLSAIVLVWSWCTASRNLYLCPFLEARNARKHVGVSAEDDSEGCGCTCPVVSLAA
ncbi:translation initiation factor IF-2-like [Panthera leo]|uniref:translation initiation factor IF-2-like n=1 Tax=Panthera leo TaxID=9689 RepID=UPI001C69833C|nr:translation initiation factor IF-2-like [Panthera leo]